MTQAIIAMTASGALAVIGATDAYSATPEQVNIHPGGRPAGE